MPDNHSAASNALATDLTPSEVLGDNVELFDSRPILLYRATCQKCRLLSALAVTISLGNVRLIALDSTETERLLAGRPRPTKFATVRGDSLKVGWPIVPALAVGALLHIISKIVAAMLRLGRYSSQE
jgi:hypothetical protein